MLLTGVSLWVLKKMNQLHWWSIRSSCFNYEINKHVMKRQKALKYENIITNKRPVINNTTL